MEIKKELVIDVSPSRVYDAITDIKQLAKWFPDVVSLEPKIGGKIVFQFQTDSSNISNEIEGKIIKLEKDKCISYTWSHPDVPDFPLTTVTWYIEKLESNKTKVVIVHSGFVDEKTMSTYNKRWLWITEHLNSFTSTEKPVSIKEQIASTLIPGVDIWAFYRIKKLRKSTLYITIPVTVAAIILTMVTFSNYEKFQSELITDEAYTISQLGVTITALVVIVASLMFANHLVRKWSKEWNAKFTESPKKNRPIGIFVLSFVYVLDAVVFALFLGFFFGVSEISSFVSDSPEIFDLVPNIAIVPFGDWIVGFGLIAIILDVLIVIGLLSANEVGRKLSIVACLGGISINVITFGITGLVVNAILLWYLFRPKTKESFKINA